MITNRFHYTIDQMPISPQRPFVSLLVLELGVLLLVDEFDLEVEEEGP